MSKIPRLSLHLLFFLAFSAALIPVVVRDAGPLRVPDLTLPVL